MTAWALAGIFVLVLTLALAVVGAVRDSLAVLVCALVGCGLCVVLGLITIATALA